MLPGLSAISSGATAAENATGIYALGYRGPLAGVTPPPGLYFQNDVYLYSGKTSASREFEFNGNIVANVRGSAQVDFPTLLYVTPIQIAGGSFALSFSEPFGHQDVNAGAVLTGPLGKSMGTSISDQTFTAGDPVVSSFIGWHAGNFHWQLGELLNIPVGDYHEGALANIAFHRFAADSFATFTWLDPKIGLDLSAAVGVTVNGENPTTLYRTGDEFHLEWAATYSFSKQLSAGPAGYFYDQFTGDSGQGAILGPLEGRVTAVGGTVSYAFDLNKIPVVARLKAFREFDVSNRFQATTGYIEVALPLPGIL